MPWVPSRRPRRPYKVSVWPELWPRWPDGPGLRWRWECGKCRPSVRGATWSLTQTLAHVRRHCRRRYSHHEYVARTRGWG